MVALTLISVLAGSAVLILLFMDVVQTVFVPFARSGIIMRRLYPKAWSAWKRLSATRGKNQRQFLSKGGALLMVMSLVVWVGMLILGFALIFLPFRDLFFLMKVQGIWSEVLSILYISAYSATTLGVGDIYPSNILLRLLVSIEAALGFSLFTAAITYLLSIGNAVLRSTSLALVIAHYVNPKQDKSLDVTSVVAQSLKSGSGEDTINWLLTVTNEMSAVVRSGEQYPLSQYFHAPSNSSAFPLAQVQLLEVITIIKTMLDPKEYNSLVNNPVVSASYSMNQKYLHAHTRLAQVANRRTDEVRLDRGGYFNKEYNRLKTAGIKLRNYDDARKGYMQIRQQWDLEIVAICRYLDYPIAIFALK